MKSYKSKKEVGFQCGCYLIIFIVNLLLGGWSVNYLLLEFFGKTLPTFWAVITGLIVGQFSIPVAFVVWILNTFNII